MGSNASEFNKSRLTINALTKKRVKFILSYVLECHKLLLEDKVEYSLSEIKKSKIKPENKFRNYFVDNYLRKNSHLLNYLRISISFNNRTFKIEEIYLRNF